jgi:hypothetical protein
VTGADGKDDQEAGAQGGAGDDQPPTAGEGSAAGAAGAGDLAPAARQVAVYSREYPQYADVLRRYFAGVQGSKFKVQGWDGGAVSPGP